MSSHALTPSEGANASEKAHHKAARVLASLLDEIAACRESILRQEAIAAEVEARCRRELDPLEKQLGQVRLETFRVLATHARETRLRKAQKTLLFEVLLAFANELEMEYGFDLSKDMGALEPHDPNGGWEMEVFKESDLHSPFGEGDSGGGGDWDGKSGDDADGPSGRGRARGSDRKRSTDNSSRTGKIPAAEQALAGDLRALYLLMARALHPDKESDPARIAEKTRWMQKVTAAYGAKDLSALLDVLARNPLDALGPYLEEAPLKTLQGFAKRLRRERDLLRRQADAVADRYHPGIADGIRSGRVKDAFFKSFASQLRKTVRFHRDRCQAYREKESLLEMLEMLRMVDWRSLM